MTIYFQETTLDFCKANSLQHFQLLLRSSGSHYNSLSSILSYIMHVIKTIYALITRIEEKFIIIYIL